MKIVLLQDIAGIGKRYDVKDVADGYARNYLIARKLAVPATPEEVKRVVAKQAAHEREEAELKKRLHVIQQTIKTHTIEFPMRVTEAGLVYGSVTKEMILKALREHAWLTKERVDVLLDHPLKELGEHKIPVDLKKGIRATLTVILRGEA